MEYRTDNPCGTRAQQPSEGPEPWEPRRGFVHAPRTTTHRRMGVSAVLWPQVYRTRAKRQVKAAFRLAYRRHVVRSGTTGLWCGACGHAGYSLS